MCCTVDLNSKKDARHFLGKDEPDLIPRLNDDNLPSGKVAYTDAPAMSAFDKLKAFFAQKTA